MNPENIDPADDVREALALCIATAASAPYAPVAIGIDYATSDAILAAFEVRPREVH